MYDKTKFEEFMAYLIKFYTQKELTYAYNLYQKKMEEDDKIPQLSEDAASDREIEIMEECIRRSISR